MKEEKGLSEQLVDFFEDHKGEAYSAAELTEKLQAIGDVMIKKLRNLIKHNEVSFEQISCRVARKIYKDKNLKRGLRLYFLD